MIYQMQEGYLTLDGEWQDRSVNMLAAQHLAVKGANLVVTREALPAGLEFTEYMSQQKNMLAKELAGFKLLGDCVETVEDLPAHILEFTWDNQGGAMYQMISVINVEDGVLNLTATLPGGPDDAAREAMLAAMKSFRFGAVPAPEGGVPA